MIHHPNSYSHYFFLASLIFLLFYPFLSAFNWTEYFSLFFHSLSHSLSFYLLFHHSFSFTMLTFSTHYFYYVFFSRHAILPTWIFLLNLSLLRIVPGLKKERFKLLILIFSNLSFHIWDSLMAKNYKNIFKNVDQN